MKKFKLGLLWRVLIAIVLGILGGLFFPAWLVRGFATFNGLFSNLLGFLIPLIIIGLITPAIAELGRGAGKWLGVTVAIAYGSTLFAGFLALGASMIAFPLMLRPGSFTPVENPEDALLTPYFTVEIPPVVGVMTALVLAFMVGVGITTLHSNALQRGFSEFRDIVNLVISKVIIPLLPLYIFGIFLNMTKAGQVVTVIGNFLPVVLYVFGLTVVLLLIQYGVAGAIARRNPITALGKMLPAYATALGTSSSAATIPVTLRSATKMGVSEPVAAFTIPLCATIHLAGSTVKITSFALAVMFLSGMPIDVPTLIGFILMLGVTMVAAPGVPGGAIVTATGILASTLGFSEAQVGLMIATYIAIDSFGTATNVTGDGAIALVIDRLSGGRARQHATVPAVVEAVEVDTAAASTTTGDRGQSDAHT